MITETIEQITQNPLFLKLKNVVENNSYHDHEDVFSHVIKVKDIALAEISADFITNPEAKKSFLSFINEDLQGFKRGDIMVLIALLHDIGKMLTVKDGDNTHPLLITNPSGITFCPGHEYWGSTIVAEVLQDLSLPAEVVNYIAKVIKLHDTFSPAYWSDKKDWPRDLLLNDVKSRAEGLYKETLFNIYCDCYTAQPFQEAKEMIVKIFNESDLYERREYVI